jgi:hypothetical protein
MMHDEKKGRKTEERKRTSHQSRFMGVLGEIMLLWCLFVCHIILSDEIATRST